MCLFYRRSMALLIAGKSGQMANTQHANPFAVRSEANTGSFQTHALRKNCITQSKLMRPFRRGSLSRTA